MFVPNSPRFRLTDLRWRPPAEPGWLDDDEWLPAGSRGLYATAKTGLMAVLETWRTGGSPVAMLPEYLPPGVVQAFRRMEFEVRPYPVEADLTLPVDRVLAEIDDVEPDVVLLAHYFGFADPAFQAVVAGARAVGAKVVEDCARGLFGRDMDGQLLGSTGDAAIYSPHKTLPVPNGGIVVAPGTSLPTPARRVPESRDLAVSAAVSTLRLLRRPPPERSGNRNRTESIRTLDATGTADLGAWVWPPAAVGHLSRCGMAATEPAAVQRARHGRYEALRSRLLSVDGVTVRSPEAPAGASPHGVVVTVNGSRAACDDVAAALRRRGLPVERFQWPLTIDAAALDAFPGARALRERLLVLPCHQQVPPRAIEPMVDTVRAAVTDQLTTDTADPLSRALSGTRA